MSNVFDSDSPTNLAILNVVLREVYNVVTATNGPDALNLAASEEPDLIILDIMMPGMDGATFLGIMRNDKRRKHIPVIAVTALTEGPLASRIRALDVKQVFRKADFELGELADAVERQLCPPGEDAPEASFKPSPMN